MSLNKKINAMVAQPAISSASPFNETASDSNEKTTKTTSKNQKQNCKNGRKRTRCNEVESFFARQDAVIAKISKTMRTHDVTTTVSTTPDDTLSSAAASPDSGDDKMSTMSLKVSKSRKCRVKAGEARGIKLKCFRFAESPDLVEEREITAEQEEDADKQEGSALEAYIMNTQGKDHRRRWCLLRTLLPIAAFLTLLLLIATIITQTESSKESIFDVKQWLQLMVTALMSWMECGCLCSRRTRSVHTTKASTLARGSGLFYPFWFFYDVCTLFVCASLFALLTGPVANFLLLLLLGLRIVVVIVLLVFLMDSPPQPRVCNKQRMLTPPKHGQPRRALPRMQDYSSV